MVITNPKELNVEDTRGRLQLTALKAIKIDSFRDFYLTGIKNEADVLNISPNHEGRTKRLMSSLDPSID